MRRTAGTGLSAGRVLAECNGWPDLYYFPSDSSMPAQESFLCCPYCGEPTEEIIEIPDEDPSTGYYNIELMCPACIREQRYREALHEGGLDPLAPLLLGWDSADL